MGMVNPVTIPTVEKTVMGCREDMGKIGTDPGRTSVIY
jgi:hypothetical protein